jgi:hypothetical protein
MELCCDYIPVHVGGNPSQYSRASGYARHELLAKLCPQDLVLLQKQDDVVHLRASHAGIHSGLGNSAAFDGKRDSE